MRFEAWPAVYLLALVPALLLLYARAFRRQRQALAAFFETDVAAQMLRRAGGGRRWARALCLVAAAICMIVALMEPHWGRGARILPLLGRDVIVLLDVSYSMLAEDAQPNRLARAKAAVRSLAEAVQRDGGHRLGLLAFAGRADVLCPLTRDYNLFLKRLEDASVDAVGRRGTSIGEALRRAVRSFGELAPGYTDLVLVSDGEDHEGLPLEAAAMLAGLGLRLHTIGVGDPERSVPIPIADEAAGHTYLVQDGQEVQTRMRKGLLVGMADAAGGANLTLENGTDRLDRFYADQIAGEPRRELTTAGDRELSPRYHYFLLCAAVLLLIEVALRRSPRAPVAGHAAGAAGQTHAPARARVWAAFAFLPILGADQAAQDVRAGNQLYQAGQYEAALRAYRAAAEALPEASPGAATVEFNQGNALFKTHVEGEALDRYLAALTTDDPGLAGRAKYNIGVIKYRQALAAAQRYEDALTLAQAAVRYFRESLELDPGLGDARYNLELAYRLQRQIEAQLLRAQENAEEGLERTSLRRGQAFSDQIRNEGGGQRRSLPNEARQPHGQRGNETPENFAANEENSEAPKTARLPMAMGADAARQLMEQLRERLGAAEVRRQEQRRRRLQQAEEATPW
jgi:Ca-activated chloride channel family protein